MKTQRAYHQTRRAAEAEANTERILRAAHDLWLERPYDQITLNAVAERAGVGVQTLIRRVQTKDGLSRAVNAWIGPQISADRGDASATQGDPQTVAAAIARHYERWGESTDRMLRQEHVSPALGEAAAAGRAAHREWIEAAFSQALDRLRPEARRRLRARLVGVCGVELWHVLRRDERLSVPEARDAVADLISASLSSHLPNPES
jgi:AcrR family transcriptional regulator